MEDNDKAITPSIRVKVQPKTFDEKVAQKARKTWIPVVHTGDGH